MPSVTLDTGDPQLRERLHDWLVHCYGDASPEVSIGKLLDVLASPEPSEPPPEVYEGSHEKFKAWAYVEGFRGIEAGSPNHWVPVGDNVAYKFAEALECGMQPDRPLRSVDELIPDPEDTDAILALRQALLPLSYTPSSLRHLCRVLRARAEARGPQPEHECKKTGLFGNAGACSGAGHPAREVDAHTHRCLACPTSHTWTCGQSPCVPGAVQACESAVDAARGPQTTGGSDA